MNKFMIEIKKWYSLKIANIEVNQYIEKCTDEGLEIVEVTSHVSEQGDGLAYTFIFKLVRNDEVPRNKEWNDERW